ncbi:MAG: spondin domain-containing protein [Calditrichota bacterium]
MKKALMLFMLIFIFGCKVNTDPLAQGPEDEQATYRLVFATTWNDSTFSTSFPANRHFSGLIGATHSEANLFWQDGVLSSVGIQRVAELGAKDSLQAEVIAAINSGSANSLLSGGDIPLQADSVEMQFTVQLDAPLVTLVTMVAPSPDWFVGVNSLNMIAQNDWRNNFTVNLPVYDAGTDDGLRFESGNLEASPFKPIQRLSSDASDTDFSDGIHRTDFSYIATFRFERVN